MSLTDRFRFRLRQWFDYETDVHAKVIASLGTVSVSEDKRGDAAYQKALDLLAHIAAARSLWLFRFGVAETGPHSVEELFPRGHTLADVETELALMHERWSEYLQGLDDEKLGRLFEYQSIEGGRFQNRIEDLLTQLFGHSSYHRGQIASVVRSLRGEPAVTDFVYWRRESI